MRNNKFLYIITLAFFVSGLINIHFALLGMICMAFPILLLFRDKKKTWCQGYCPRAGLYTTVGKFKKQSRKTPLFFTKGNMKWIILIYFGISLFIIIMSTIGVARGRIPAMDYLRFLIIIPVPGSMPQLFDITGFAPRLTHLSYRFYSMMMTTTSLGLLMAVFYKPRTWCTVCPINTISDVYLSSAKNSKKNAQEA